MAVDTMEGRKLLSNPTLAAILKSDDVSPEIVLTYVGNNANALALWSHVLSLVADGGHTNAGEIVRLLRWCMRCVCLSSDVGVRATHLRILHELECYDEFHAQCCQMTCCLATEVVELMTTQREKCLRLASEIVLLQNVINPLRFCCTQRQLELWLAVLNAEEPGLNVVAEHIDKMLGMVESAKHLVIFLQVLVRQYGMELGSQCTLLACSVLQQLRQLVSVEPSSVSRVTVDIIDVCDSVRLLYHDDRDMTQSCLLSALHLHWSKQRADALRGDLPPGPSAALRQGLVDRRHYDSLLAAVTSLRDINIDCAGTSMNSAKNSGLIAGGLSVENLKVELCSLQPVSVGDYSADVDKKSYDFESEATDYSKPRKPDAQPRAMHTDSGKTRQQMGGSGDGQDVSWKDGENKKDGSDADDDIGQITTKDKISTNVPQKSDVGKSAEIPQLPRQKLLLRISNECCVRISPSEEMDAWESEKGKKHGRKKCDEKPRKKSEKHESLEKSLSDSKQENMKSEGKGIKLKIKDDLQRGKFDRTFDVDKNCEESMKIESECDIPLKKMKLKLDSREKPTVDVCVENPTDCGKKSPSISMPQLPNSESESEKNLTVDAPKSTDDRKLESKPRVHFKRSLLERERERACRGQTPPETSRASEPNASLPSPEKPVKLPSSRGVEYIDDEAAVPKVETAAIPLMDNLAPPCPELSIRDSSTKIEPIPENPMEPIFELSDDECIMTQAVVKTYERSHRMKFRQDKEKERLTAINADSTDESCGSSDVLSKKSHLAPGKQTGTESHDAENSPKVRKPRGRPPSKNRPQGLDQRRSTNSGEKLPTSVSTAVSENDRKTNKSEGNLETENDSERCTTEEVFRKIASESQPQICKHCQAEVRTRTQMLFHADGKCLKKSAGAAPVSKRRDRSSSDAETVGPDRPSAVRHRRSTAELLDVECRGTSGSQAGDISGGGGGIRNCVIEITPLVREPVPESSSGDTSPTASEGDRKLDDCDDALKICIADDVKDELVEDSEASKSDVLKTKSEDDAEVEKPSDVNDGDSSKQHENEEDTVAERVCVCDGCGEMVPGGSWLAAHTSICPGRTSLKEEESVVVEPKTTSLLHPVVPAESAATATTAMSATPSGWDPPAVVLSAENPVGLDPQGSDAAGAHSVDVDAASLLQLLCSVENSLLQSDANAAHGAVSDVKLDIGKQIVGTSGVVENGVDDVAQAAVDMLNLDSDGSMNLGRTVTHDGVEMYEFLEYRCSACPVSFVDEGAAMKHSTGSGVHGVSAIEPLNVYCCVQCSMRFHDQQLMWYHATYICAPRADVAPPPINSEELYHCSFCAKTFLTIDYLNRHLRLRHSEEIAAAASHLEILGDWTNSAGAELSDPTRIAGKSGLGSRQQTLLDLACSMVLEGGGDGENSTSGTAAATQGVPATLPIRRTAKGIVYKNVFMQCIVSYLCSNCGKDLSMKVAKREHRAAAPLSCFDEGPGGRRLFTYVRHYSYLCPYCGDRAATQKACRAHQLNTCLPHMGVKTDELNHKQLLCPFCQRKYFNVITLKGHMTLVHQIGRAESAALVASMGDLVGGAGNGEDGAENPADDPSGNKKHRDFSDGSADSQDFETVDSASRVFSNAGGSAGSYGAAKSGGGISKVIPGQGTLAAPKRRSTWRRPKKLGAAPVVRKKVVRHKPESQN